jgi:hypothetical protein
MYNGIIERIAMKCGLLWDFGVLAWFAVEDGVLFAHLKLPMVFAELVGVLLPILLYVFWLVLE